MPHVALVAFTGFRVREKEMLALGMSLPGLKGRAAAIGQLPALGLLTLAGMTPESWSCSYHEFIHAQAENVEKIWAERPDLVAISALTASVEEAYIFARRIRERGIKVVLGGLHATACPEEVLLHCDAVVVGEGEPIWHDLLGDAANGTLQARYHASAPFDLAKAPIPRFDLLGNSARPRLTLQTQRGCPLACEFCGASRLLGSFREKPTENLRKEIEALGNLFREPLLELADDNTFAGPRRASELFDVMAPLGARYFTEVDWRVGERPEILAGLADSGCVQVLVGIESLVFRTPGMGPKQTDLGRLMDALMAIQEAGVAVIGCCIVGCDGETRESLDRLAEFLLACPLADVQLTLQTPFPGTALYRRLRSQGRLLTDRSWSAYTLFDLTYQPDTLGAAELEQAFKELVCTVFSDSANARRQAIRKRVWRRHPRLRPCASEHLPLI